MASNDEHTYWIDDDLWPEILKRVSAVKTLCRFRCVHKSWSSLLSSHQFMKDHLAATSSGAANKKSYLLYGIDFTTAVYNPQATSYQRFTNLLSPSLRFPLKFRHQYCAVVDAINGVVCSKFLQRGMSIAFLWTPTVKNLVKIPTFPNAQIYNYSSELYRVGFGFDCSKGDFKFVKIYGDHRVCEVYSVQDGKWRAMNIPGLGLISMKRDGIFLNGSIHWVTAKGGLLVFDCEREEFRSLELPEEVKDRAIVFRHCGMLSLVMEMAIGRYDLWVMEEYGVASTWKKLLCIDNREAILGRRNAKRLAQGDNQKDVLDKRGVIFAEDGILEEDIAHRPDRFCDRPLLGIALRESMFMTDPKLNALSS